MILPIYGSLPASLQLYKSLGLYDNLGFLFVGTTGVGMGIILYGNAFGAMPTAYKEAAVIDGAGHFTIMWKIYMPLIFPLAAANYIMNFMGFWNDYSLNVIWMPSYPNLAYGVFIYQSNASLLGASVPELLAGMVALAIPSVILWICSQKLISTKLAMGGIKG
jgi:ABC-type glycerol-3-phosphate transport system permease component